MNESQSLASDEHELKAWKERLAWLEKWEREDMRTIEENIELCSRLRWRHPMNSGFHNIGESLRRIFEEELRQTMKQANISEMKIMAKNKIKELEANETV